MGYDIEEVVHGIEGRLWVEGPKEQNSSGCIGIANNLEENNTQFNDHFVRIELLSMANLRTSR